MAVTRDKPRLCPWCGALLRAWQVGPVTLDGCDECGGVWFDGEELKSVSNLPGEPLEALEGEFTRGLGGGAGGGSMTCPADGTPLEPKQPKQAPELTVDVCPACRGVWLDEGELAALARKLPKRSGPMPMADADVRQLEAVATLVRSCFCPRCGARNPELGRYCDTCGADLHEPPRGATGNVLSSHRLQLWQPFVEVLFLAALVYVFGFLFLGTRMYFFFGQDQFREVMGRGVSWWPAGLVVALWLLSWPWRTLGIERTSSGLVVHRLSGRRFIPWDGIRSAAVFDVGTRAVWYPLVAALGWGRRGTWNRWGRNEAMDELMEGDRPRATMMLFTSRGLVKINPSLTDHMALIDAIRERM